jgi:hypothetical protein
LHALQEYAKNLIETNLKSGGGDSSSSTRTSASIVVAGGGGHAISTLSSTSGASSLLLEGVVAYDRNAYLRYCNMPDTKGFVFSSHEAARVASLAALKQALNIRSMDDNVRLMARCVGVGSASALVSGSSSSSQSSSDGVKGYGHVVATRADGLQLSLNITLEGRLDDRTDGRSRMDEDIFLSHLILRSIEHLERNCPKYIDIVDGGTISTTTTTTTAGDTIAESWSNVPTSVDSVGVIEAAARRVVEGGEDAVVLLPLYETSEGGSGATAKPVSFRALSEPVLPNHCIVFPGSFNPPHTGHVALANASIRTLERLQPYVHRRHNDKPVFFELSLMNADKPAIDPATVAERIQQFLQLYDDDDDDDDDGDNSTDHERMPQQWGIILTRAPLFAQKLSSLQDCIINRLDGPTPNVNFVIGTDTLVRILNAKYYNNDRENMVSSLLAMKGAHFIVGGRLEQNQVPDSVASSAPPSPPKFVSGEDELKGLPSDLADMFTVMTESEFRVDISSSEIRAAAAAATATAVDDN